jgi:isocitrate dehydrogenase
MAENLKRTDLINAIEETRKSFDTDNPTVPFIEGDGIGIDIWPAAKKFLMLQSKKLTKMIERLIG